MSTTTTFVPPAIVPVCGICAVPSLSGGRGDRRGGPIGVSPIPGTDPAAARTGGYGTAVSALVPATGATARRIADHVAAVDRRERIRFGAGTHLMTNPSSTSDSEPSSRSRPSSSR